MEYLAGDIIAVYMSRARDEIQKLIRLIYNEMKSRIEHQQNYLKVMNFLFVEAKV